MKLILFYLIFIPSIYAQTPSGESCSFYQEMEDRLRCTERDEDFSSYLIFYGAPICSYFLDKAQIWEDERSEWVHRVALCLQQRIDQIADKLSCKEMEYEAFESHPECYKEAGFCELTKRQQLSIVSALTKRREVFKRLRLTLKQGVRLLRLCRIGTIQENI